MQRPNITDYLQTKLQTATKINIQLPPQMEHPSLMMMKKMI